MICVRCGGDNPPFFRFCRNCGRPLGQTCLFCGFENPPDSRFCGGCSARLQEVRPEDTEGERRQLTVLFCDIVGSTQMAQVLDPEDLGEFIAAYQRICGDAVHAQEGHIAHYLGDGVVVYFGYPRAHEDEAQRAVRCGLDILAGVRDLHETSPRPEIRRLDVRLGAHTGRVVVGPVGAGDRKEAIALGDTPNIAARIQSQAQPGTLTVSETTWRIVEGYFTGTCLGETELRGVSEPMRLWVVKGENPSRERVEVVPFLAPFVGRGRERAVLEEAWKESRSGRGRFVLLRGDPGMGKSRLAQLLRDDVDAEAAALISMRATPYDTNSPFRPVVELLERRFGVDAATAPPKRLEILEDRLAEFDLADPESVVLFASLLGIPAHDRYAPLPLSPARRRARTMELLVELIGAMASIGPTLLIVEDLHWMDTATLDFLELLVTTGPRSSLLGVLTARSELDLDWFAAPALRTVELGRFERSETEAMVRGVTANKALPPDVLRQIIARSDGVPLFVEELTWSVLSSGMLSERAASWEALGPVSQEMIPATVDASLTSRIDRLGASRGTAQLAATIGREFSFVLLAAVSERDEPTLRSDLERLVRSGLARCLDDDEGVYEFKHALVRDAAYNSLLRSKRQNYHGRIAATMRERFPALTAARPDLVADHLTNAGQDEEAVPFWQAAGQQALERAAINEAAVYFQRAVDCLGRLPATPARDERELELRVTLAPLLMTVYGWGSVEVQRTCERALMLAQKLERPDLTYPPLWGLWTVRFLRGEMNPALEAAETVRAIALASGVPMLQITGHHAAAYTLAYRGDLERAVEEADAGLALFDFETEKQIANTFQLSSSVALGAARGHSLWMLGRAEEAEEQWADMLRLARDLDHPPSLAAALAFTLHAGYRRFYTGELEGLDEVAEELTHLAQAEDFFLWYAVACTYRGLIALANGNERASSQVEEGLELFAHTGTRLTLVMMNVLWAEALSRLGKDEEASGRLEAAEIEMQARAEGLTAPDIWRIRGHLLAREGDVSGAASAYRQAIERARAQRALSLELRAALDLQDLRPEDAHPLLAGLVDRFTQGRAQPDVARAIAIARSSP